VCLVASVTYIALVCFGRHRLVCGCVSNLYRSCVFFGEQNGSVYYGNCCGVRGSFAEDAVAAKVFVRTSYATEKRYTEQDFPYVPFWSPGTGDSIPQVHGPHSE